MYRSRFAPAAIALVAVSLPTVSFIKAPRPRSPLRRADMLEADLHLAIQTRDWEVIDRAAVAMLNAGVMRDLASIARGYSSLARGDSTTGAGHFLRVKKIDSAANEVKWARTSAMAVDDNPVGHLFAGDVLIRSGAVEEGLAQFENILSREPDFVLARLALVLAQTISGRSKTCEDDLETLTLQEMTRTDGLILSALANLEDARVNEALSNLESALTLAPSHPVVHHVLGLVHARRQEWATAADEFEAAFLAAPELVAARRNRRAVVAAESRGTTIAAEYKMGVFVTGIQSEGDVAYPKAHAEALLPGREPAYLYVGIKGKLPLEGVEKARQQGFQTVVADPRNPGAATAQIDQFVRTSVAAGKNPAISIDVNKWIPTQLGNHKPETEEFPAMLAVSANRSFTKALTDSGSVGSSVLAGHSDGTRVVLKASTMASQERVPFRQGVVESPRSEVAVVDAVRRSPKTEFTVVQPVKGDLVTEEAQQRMFSGHHGAYQTTIDTFKKIDAPNYRLALIEDPSRSSPSLLHPAGAHGDSASYDRWSEVSLWRDGDVIGRNTGRLGDVLSRQTSVNPTSVSDGPSRRLASDTVGRGGVWMSSADVRRGAGGRIIFGDSCAESTELQVVYPVFGSAEWSDDSRNESRNQP
jgi:tetratricopeptide (TPR) repeat protein